jgi:type VI secretion system ImpA family protein
MKSVDHYTALFLAPITTENAVGKSLRYEEVFEQVKDLRKNCGSLLESIEGNAQSLDHVASQLCEVCENVLSFKSKDFLVMVWWVEGLFLKNGPCGLLTGLRVLSNFIEAYWDTGFPLLSEGQQIQARSQIFDWFDKTISKEALLTSILVKPSGVSKIFNLFEIGKIDQLSNTFTKVRKSQVKQADKKLYEEFKKDEQELLITLEHATESYFEVEVQNILECGVEIKSLAKTLSQKYQLDFSGFDNIEKNFEKRLQFLKRHQFLAANSSKTEIDATQQNTLESGRPSSKSASKSDLAQELTINTRQLLKYLEDLDDEAEIYSIMETMFKKLEVLTPHSPVPLFGKKVMSLKDMTFLDMMEALIDDERSLEQMKRFLGIEFD